MRNSESSTRTTSYASFEPQENNKYEHFEDSISQQQTLDYYRIATAPTTAAPSIAQVAVCREAAPEPWSPWSLCPPWPPSEEPLCGSPSAVDSFALSFLEDPENGLALMPVLFLQDEGSLFVAVEENWISAHCNNQSAQSKHHSVNGINRHTA